MIDVAGRDLAASIDPRELVLGSVRVRDVSGRNPVLLVASSLAGSRVLKRSGTAAATEAKVLGGLARDPGLAPGLPKVLRVRDGEIQLEAVRGRALAETARTGRQPGMFVAGAVGAFLARLHAADGGTLDASPLPRPFRDGWPWVTDLPNMSWAVREIVEIIQTSQRLSALLVDLRESWDASTPIHGDLRDANLVAGPIDEQQVTIIDWEVAGIGDPAWDLATVIGERLGTWVVGRVGGQGEADAAAHSADLRACLQTLWTVYWGDTADDDRAERALRWAPVRLLQWAMEHSSNGLRLTPTERAAIQLADNLAAEPGRLRADIIDL